MADQTRKQRTLGTIAALNTILERYPKLISWDLDNGVETTFTAISFLMDVLRLFGITEEFILEWLVKLISGTSEGGVEKGILFAINEAIKALLIAYLNGMYDCPIDPVLPDEFLKSPYSGNTLCRSTLYNKGYTIPVDEIDAFGLLQNVPTSSGGSIFYFDVESDYFNASNVYASTDMDAFLWFVINRGNVNAVNADLRCIWDNRNTYRFRFEDIENGGKSLQADFVDTICDKSPMRVVRGIGPKKEIIYCEFSEKANGYEPGAEGTHGIKQLFNTNCITVYGVCDRYYRTGLNGLNKTIYQFNFDYVSSLKLFDAKTLVAQVVNALIGISRSISVNFSLEKNILYEKIKDIVQEIMDEPEEESKSYEEYFTFSDERYSKITEDATLKYSGKYSTGNETGDLEDIDVNGICDAIAKISPSVSQEEMEQSVMSALVGVSDILSRSGYVDTKDKYSFKLSIITDFINELMVQLAMQILTPKVMLIFAINNRFLNGTEEAGSIRSIEEFFKDFWNIMKSCIKRITKMIMDALIDMVVGQIKPIIDLVIRKLLLETIMYYRMLLEQVLLACSTVSIGLINPLFQYGNLMIDNVDYADIIPTETTPKQ